MWWSKKRCWQTKSSSQPASYEWFWHVLRVVLRKKKEYMIEAICGPQSLKYLLPSLSQKSVVSFVPEEIKVPLTPTLLSAVSWIHPTATPQPLHPAQWGADSHPSPFSPSWGTHHIGVATWQSFLHCARSHQTSHGPSPVSGWMLKTKRPWGMVEPKHGTCLGPQITTWKKVTYCSKFLPMLFQWARSNLPVAEPVCSCSVA